MKKNILFVCTGNAVRSQMAHAYFNHFTENRHNVYSAGIMPAGVISRTKKTMALEGISLAEHTSNHVDDYLHIDFDYVIVLCEVAFMSLPRYNGEYKLLKWFIDDPIRILGNDKRKDAGFVMARNIIKNKVLDFIDLNKL